LAQFFIDFGSILGGFWKPTWQPKSIKIQKISDLADFQKQGFRVDCLSKTRFRAFRNQEKSIKDASKIQSKFKLTF